MSKVIGKEQLCSTDLKYFKALQGKDGKTYFNRYKSLENIVKNNIDTKYQDFLAHPVEDGNIITFHGKKYNEAPHLLSDLRGNDLVKYSKIKAETLNHYNGIIDSLKNSGKATEAEFLADATKYVDNRFVYCYDDKVVLGVWGMQLRENIREDISKICKNLATKKKKLQPESELLPKAPLVNPFTVRFHAGEGGKLNGTPELTKYNNEIITEGEVPKIEAKEGYEFIGWDRNPNNYSVTGDTEFTAQYRPIVPPPVPLPWWKRFWLWFTEKGCLKWLLWLLLLILLLLLLLWLLRRCSDDNTPASALSPCNTTAASGGDEGYIESFEMGQNSGSFLFQYETYTAPDKITIYEGDKVGGKPIFEYTGGTKGWKKETVNFNNHIITIEIVGLEVGTKWTFVVNCPETQKQPNSNLNNPPADSRSSKLKQKRDSLQKELDRMNDELRRIGKE